MSILFPDIPSCVYCGRELPRGEVCPACRRKLAPLALFGRAAYPFACCGAYRYGEVIRRLIWRYKFEGARWLSKYIAGEMLRALSGEAFDLVCFVPLHPRRLAWRGFNQSQLLAERIALGRGCPCIPALVRIRNTHAQAKLPHDERAANVAGAFALRPGAAEVLSGRRVLLVDDVVTTGATIGGCREQLRAAGAEVLCAAFTVTAGGGDSPLRFGKNSI